MIKRYLILFLLCFACSSYADFLDDWSNDDLCGWMQSSEAPEYIQTEVQKRKIICYGGVEVSSLPADNSNNSGDRTFFPSPDSSLMDEIKATYDLGPKSVMGY